MNSNGQAASVGEFADKVSDGWNGQTTFRVRSPHDLHRFCLTDLLQHFVFFALDSGVCSPCVSFVGWEQHWARGAHTWKGGLPSSVTTGSLPLAVPLFLFQAV